MPEKIVELTGDSFDEIAAEIQNYESLGSLQALRTENGLNYAAFDTTELAQPYEVTIRPSPAAEPDDTVKICEGTLTIEGVPMDVVAFGESTLPDRDGPPQIYG